MILEENQPILHGTAIQFEQHASWVKFKNMVRALYCRLRRGETTYRLDETSRFRILESGSHFGKEQEQPDIEWS